MTDTFDPVAVLRELVELKEMKDEIVRLKGRRAVWLKRDVAQVDRLAKLEEDYKRRKPLAWHRAKVIVLKHTDTGDGHS